MLNHQVQELHLSSQKGWSKHFVHNTQDSEACWSLGSQSQSVLHRENSNTVNTELSNTVKPCHQSINKSFQKMATE